MKAIKSAIKIQYDVKNKTKHKIGRNRIIPQGKLQNMYI